MNATISGCSSHQSESALVHSRATDLVHLLAGEDDPAVHDPGHDRQELLGCNGDHALVQQREALSNPSVLDEHVALPEDRKRE